MEDCHIAKVVERLMLSFARIELPEIVDVNLPLEGIFHGTAIVAIDKRHPGQARKVMDALWSGSWLRGSRLIAVVDADVDIHDVSTTFWKILNSVDWKKDLVVPDTTSNQDKPGHVFLPYGGRIGIDATRKLPEEGFQGTWPKQVARGNAIRDLVSRRWREYGF